MKSGHPLSHGDITGFKTVVSVCLEVCVVESIDLRKVHDMVEMLWLLCAEGELIAVDGIC